MLFTGFPTAGSGVLSDHPSSMARSQYFHREGQAGGIA